MRSKRGSPEKLKAFMRERKIRNYELAEELGVDRVTVSRWRTGNRPITVNTALQIAALYRLNWKNLLSD